VNLESVWYFSRLLSDIAEGVNVHSGRTNAAVLPGALESRPFRTQPIFGFGLVRLARFVVWDGKEKRYGW
jgi:hypothetical protein